MREWAERLEEGFELVDQEDELLPHERRELVETLVVHRASYLDARRPRYQPGWLERKKKRERERRERERKRRGSLEEQRRELERRSNELAREAAEERRRWLEENPPTPRPETVDFICPRCRTYFGFGPTCRTCELERSKV